MSLLERETELATILEVVDTGGVVLIEGGAGIGKTSLLSAAASHAATLGREILRARGSELEEGFAFGLVRQIFERRIAAAEGSERDALFDGAAAAARPLISGDVARLSAADVSFAVLHGLYWLASNVSARRHLVIVVDDAHWGDDASLRWLAYTAARVEGLHLSVEVALRPTDRISADAKLRALRASARIVRPTLLSETAVAAIVRESVPSASDDLCVAVWRESGGNPFYLHELLRPIGSSAGTVEASSFLERPGEGVAQHVAARLRSLDPRALRVAQVLAVLGDGCQLRHVAAIVGVRVTEAARVAASLVRAEVLASDHPPRFLHPILNEAVEASLGNDQRDADHHAAARLLYEDRSHPGIVAAHLLQTRPSGDPWLVTRLREAALAAIESGAARSGAELLRRAIAEPPPPDERAAVLRQAGRAEALCGRQSSTILLEDALRLVADRRERAAIGLELAESFGSSFRWVEAVDACERALTELGDADQRLAARLEANMVVCGLRDSRRAVRVLPVLDRLGRRDLESGPAEAYAVACGLKGLWFEGWPADRVAEILADAFQRAGPRPDNWDLRAPGLWALIVAEGFFPARETLAGMLREVQRSGSARGTFVSHAILSLLQYRLGALPDADANARIALRVMQEADFAPGLPLGLQVLANVAIESGQLDEAEELLEQLPRTDLVAGLSTVHISPVRGRLRLAQGRPRDALAEFELGRTMLSEATWGAIIHDNGFVHVRSGLAEALLGVGEREQALELAESELADARRFGAARALGIALRTAGLVRGGDDGLQLLEEAVAVHNSSPALLERAHSLAQFGAALRRAGRRSAARQPLLDALDLAARCGARPLTVRVREELKASGARPRREWRTGIDALTPSELRVARLAAEGRTNREIAQQLFVTLKTVEGHLARAYDKLDITSRAELRRGLKDEKTRVPTP